MFYIPELNANSVDPDQMPHSAASDLGLHCLPVSHSWDTRLNGFMTVTITVLFYMTGGPWP